MLPGTVGDAKVIKKKKLNFASGMIRVCPDIDSKRVKVSKAKSSQTPDSIVCHISNAVSCKEPVNLKRVSPFLDLNIIKEIRVGAVGIVSESRRS